MVTRYNHRDQPAEVLFEDQSGRLLSRVDFLYGDDGNLMEEIHTDLGAAMPMEGTPAQLEAVRSLFGLSVNRIPTMNEAVGVVLTRESAT